MSKITSKKISNEQEIKMVEEYRKGASSYELMNKYGFKTRKSITDKIKKHYPDKYGQILKEGKENRKGYNYKFNKINSEFDAYFLGLLLTDGYVSIDEDKRQRHTVGIDLIDEDCINFLSKTIGKKYSKYTSPNYQTRYRLILEDKELVRNLSKYGVVPRKSLIVPYLNLQPEEEKFIPYIIRGIIDGDGTACPATYGGAQFKIVTASYDFARWLVDILTNKMYMVDINIRLKNNNNLYEAPIYEIGSANQHNIQILIALSYNKPYGMMRKYEKIRKTFRDYNQDWI